MDHRGHGREDGRDEGRENAAEGNAHGEDEAEDAFGAVDRKEDREQQDDVEHVLRHGGDVVREGDREEGAEEERSGKPCDHADGRPRSFPTLLNADPPLDSAGEEPRHPRQEKKAPPVGDGRQVGPMQEVVADDTAMQVLPEEISEVGECHQCCGGESESLTFVFRHDHDVFGMLPDEFRAGTASIRYCP